MAIIITLAATALACLTMISTIYGQEGRLEVLAPFVKCRATTTQEALLTLCYKEVTGKTNVDNVKPSEITSKEREDTLLCAFRKHGVITFDDKFNERKGLQFIDTLQAEPEVRENVKKEFQLCLEKSKPNNFNGFADCNYQGFVKLCTENGAVPV